MEKLAAAKNKGNVKTVGSLMDMPFMKNNKKIQNALNKVKIAAKKQNQAKDKKFRSNVSGATKNQAFKNSVMKKLAEKQKASGKKQKVGTLMDSPFIKNNKKIQRALAKVQKAAKKRKMLADVKARTHTTGTKNQDKGLLSADGPLQTWNPQLR